MKAKILQVKMTSKKGLACLLAVLMLLTALPLGLVTSAMAATKDCMVVEVQGKKVYFFGAESLSNRQQGRLHSGKRRGADHLCGWRGRSGRRCADQ